jgi:hypothetical protein
MKITKRRINKKRINKKHITRKKYKKNAFLFDAAKIHPASIVFSKK